MKVPFRYRRLGYVALNVSNIEKSTRFYVDQVGLDLSEAVPGGPAFLRCSHNHHDIVLYPSGGPGLRRVAFELETQADFARAREYLQGLGLAVTDVSPEECKTLKQGESLRFEEPNSGLTFEFYWRMLHMAVPFAQRLTRIERLGHIVLSVEAYEQVLDFVTNQLGFGVSDTVEGVFSWMRARPNPLHHTFALGRSKQGNHLHHVNFMVRDIDDIGRAVSRMRKNNTPIVFGPGRHKPSTSIFLYFLDPDGMTLEYSFGMEEFPEEGAREPRMLEMHPDTLDLWGGSPRPEFATVGPFHTKGQA
ncbi:MAG TPA: VOC family protein [Reyranella sp.]|jgi:2,3-dihydroxy-p-cumate/2,3-dihydroxybenzoate 3,4-dioxygenase|nr:VOC family protein [Reyranella sp.]